MTPGPFPPIVDVNELRTALAKVLDAVESQHGSQVVINQDFYRIMPVNLAFDLGVSNPEWTMGSLVDDVDSMRSFNNAAEDEPVSIWHELAHLAGILRGLESIDCP